MSDDAFDRLLGAMPRIADAVKVLPPELQQAAYNDLVAAFNGTPAVMPKPIATPEPESCGADRAEENEESENVSPERKAPARKTAARKSSARKNWRADRSVDFWPDGKQSFESFAAEKQPRTNHEKNLVAIFWFEEIADLGEIGVNQVLAAFKDRGWNEPANPENALQVAASTKNWLDTSNMKKIATTSTGRNAVKGMPKATK
jgi:hypothetical protein